MTDFFLQVGLSNACFSLALAIVTMVVGAKTKRPHLAHLLWLLVFVKLVTPPIVTIPVVTIPKQPDVLIKLNVNRMCAIHPESAQRRIHETRLFTIISLPFHPDATWLR